jgi:hypothetical protein
MSQVEQAPRSGAASSEAIGRVSRRDVLRGVGAGALAVAAGVSPSGSSLAARKQAVDITTFPRHDSWTASPYTEIGFRGVTAEELGVVTVIGTHSGGRSGIVMPHADGNGASFVPDARFEPGEIVTVTAGMTLPGTDGGTLRFGVAVPAEITPSPAAPEPLEEGAEPVPTRTFRSRPDLTPPTMSVATPANGTAEGSIFLSSNVNGGQSGAAMLDNDGDYIWFQPTANPVDTHYDVRVQEYQGEQVITFVEGNGPTGYRFGHFVILDSSYQPIAQFQIGNGYTGGDLHEFLLTPEGTAIVGVYHPIVWDLSPAGGPRHGVALDNIIQELEIDTGRVLFEWHSLDDVAIDETIRSIPAEPDEPFDYFHLNSIDRDDNGDYYVSARHTNAIYKIAGATGAVAWRLNGERSDFEMGEGTPFALQHDARARGNGQLSLFDNASDDFGTDATMDSRGLLLDLDEEAMTATLAREYIHPTGILSVSRANMQVLPNGNVFIGWGAAPVFSEFTEDGDLIFDGRYPHGGTSYRAYRFPWVGQPAEPPAVAVERGAGDVITAYASWNGATEVTTWRVLAGSSPSELLEVGTAPRAGFETEIEMTTSEPYIAVEALDAAGEALGASDAIEV